VKLKGTPPNTDAIGAVVTVVTGGVKQISIVQSGTSYISQDDMRRHFGLGAATEVDEISVRWPDGTVTTQQKVKANQIVQIAQGK